MNYNFNFMSNHTASNLGHEHQHQIWDLASQSKTVITIVLDKSNKSNLMV